MILKVGVDPTELPDRVRAELTGADHAVAPDRFAGAAQPVDVEVLLEVVPQRDTDERPAVQRRLIQPPDPGPCIQLYQARCPALRVIIGRLAN